jgi:hypothetical protein
MPATGVTPTDRVASPQRRSRSASLVDRGDDPRIPAAGLETLDFMAAPIREGPAAVELR